MFKRWRRRPSTSPLPSVTAYALWAGRYPPHAHNPLMEAEEAAMRALLPNCAGQVVLDLACGTGRYGLLALAGGAQQVIGLDNSPQMLRAGALPRRALAEMAALPLAGESVDGVVCGLALGHIPHLEPVLAEMGRVLKAGGWALVSDIHPCLSASGAQRTFTAPDGRTVAVEHYIHWYADYHRAAVAAGLRIDDVLEPRLQVEPAATSSAPAVVVYRLAKPRELLPGF